MTSDRRIEILSEKINALEERVVELTRLVVYMAGEDVLAEDESILKKLSLTD